MNKLILLTPLLLLMLMGIAGATTPSTIPSGIQYYVPLNLTNSQSTATSAPFQQMVNITESTYSSYIAYSGSTANFEYFYSNGTIIPAWIESNSSGKLITWVKTISIPASSHIQIYLGFASKTTNLLSSTGTSGIGEAPQLSSTYAQYDDGASVFNNYWNFNGTTLPTSWTASGVSYTVNNGISVGATTEGTKGTLLTTNTIFNAPEVLDIYGTQNYDTSTYQGIGALYITSSVNSGTFFYTSSSSAIYMQQTTSSGATTADSTSVGTAPLTAIYTIQATSTTSNYFVNYGSEATLSTDAPTYPLQVGILTAITAQDSITWIRTRAYPPSGVMPSVTFGAVQLSISLSISPNPATYGQSVTLTATCPVSTDTCAIDYPSLGTAIATGTGSATYTWNTTKEGIGTFSSFYANDITLGTNSTPQSLTTYVPINIYYANATSSEIHKTLNTSGLYLIPACTNNAASLSLGYCIGNMVYSTSTTLQGNIYVFGNITIDSGVTITENGHYMYATNTFDNLGTITGGNNPNAPGGVGAEGTGGAGTSYPSSYAGSGGSGSSTSGYTGGNGGSTLAPGGVAPSAGSNGNPGSTPSAPTMSQSLAKSIFANVTKYLSSGSGGGNGGTVQVNGGQGVFGVAIGGNKVIAGTINTDGNAGAYGTDSSGSGAAGAGAILITYNASYTAGTYSYSGGTVPSGTPSGGVGGNGQVILYDSMVSLPISSSNYYYPLKYNASTTSNTISFNVSITNLAINSKSYQSSNQSLSYFPSSTAPYLLSFKEQQGTQKAYLNTTFVLNATTINSAFNFSTPIQYFPILAHTPTWTAKPSSWEIIPANEPVVNQQLNTSAGAVFSSPNLQVNFTNTIKLNYPFTSFYLNFTNNPKVQTSLTLQPFKFIASNTLPASPYTRNLTEIRSYSEYTKLPLNTNTSYSVSSLFNNYTIQTTGFTALDGDANSVMVYMPQSNYANPIIFLSNQTTFSTAGTPYYGRENNYFNTQLSFGSWDTKNIYLPPSNVSSPYGMAISSCTGVAATGDYVTILSGPQGSQLQVQQEIIPNSPSFAVYLVNSYLYQFDIYSPAKALVYKSAISSWTSPISLPIPCNVTVTPITLPNVNATCNWKPSINGTLNATCTGVDLNDLVNKWKVEFINQSTVLTSTVMQTDIINASSFSVSYLFPSNHSSYSAKVVAMYGKTIDPTQTFTFVINPTAIYSTSALGLLTILFILAPIALAYFDKNLMLIVYVAFIFMGQALGGIFTFLGYSTFDVIAFIVFSVIMLIISELR